jgi:3-dehydroquinate synthase
LIGAGLLEEVAACLACRRAGSPAAVVTDPVVGAFYRDRLMAALAKGAPGLRVAWIEVPAGEGAKRLSELERLYHQFAGVPLDRRSVVVAFGGGVVGDLAGFAAATYLRGIDLIQVPTTLLAQVDASVGGKTGIDLPEGKNLVGAFHQPRRVIADLETLQTLPAAQLRAGLAEVIKYGVIADPSLLDILEAQREPILAGEPAALEELVVRSCRIKAEVVAGDERETGRRAILNFGHTIGHALEAATGYGEYLHGEAVAIGMVAAARLSCRLAGLPAGEARRLEELMRAYGLPSAPRKPVAPERLLEAARRDKKARAGDVHFVLANRLGEVDLYPVPERVIRDTLETLNG